MKYNIILIMAFLPAILNASEHEEVYRGAYSWGHEAHSFKPCNEKSDYWVSFDWAGIEMHNFYKNAQKEPYQLMYIEFRGQILNEAVDGFAAEYAGLIRISHVKKFTFDIPAQCK